MTLSKKLFKSRKVLVSGIAAFIIYLLVYLWSIGHIIFGSYSSVENLVILENWSDLIFKARAPFNFEPVAYIQISNLLRFLISPANILLGMLLGLLVMINVSCVVYMYTLPKQCRIDTKFSGFIGILPSFLTGFACCVPSFIIPLASIIGSSVSFLTSIFKWFLPASILLLIFGAFTGLKKVAAT